jgi:hypothetical protein
MKEVSPEATKLRLVISPELALVDPELRARAVAALGGEERWTYRAPPPPVTAHPSRAVAALAYLAVAIVHTLAVEAAFAALVVLVVLILALSS